jgi:hypothetical protein
MEFCTPRLLPYKFISLPIAEIATRRSTGLKQQLGRARKTTRLRPCLKAASNYRPQSEPLHVIYVAIDLMVLTIAVDPATGTGMQWLSPCVLPSATISSVLSVLSDRRRAC